MDVSLANLQQQFEDARDEQLSNPSDDNFDLMNETMEEFADARHELKQAEENNPDHPRGTGLVVVTNEDGEQ